MYLTGTRTPATGKTVVVTLSKAGAAFGAAAGAVSEVSGGWYKVALTTADTDTLHELAFNCTNTDCDPTQFTDQVGPIPANIQQINGDATDGNNATLSLKQLNIVNSAGSALVASATGSNGNGINASGNGTGNGLNTTGGITGNGIGGNGGATSGSGMYLQALNSGSGLVSVGVAGAGVTITAGTNSPGMSVQGGGTGAGIRSTGGLTGDGISGVGGATSGSGLSVVASGSGAGITATGTSNGNGITATGNGSGVGIQGQGGGTGAGIRGTGGGTSGEGIKALAVGGGAGINAVGVGNVSLLATQGLSGPLDTATYNAIADALLIRDWTLVATASNFSVLNALRFLRNKWSISGTTLTVTKENEVDPAWTATLTTDATALPVVSFIGS